MHCFTEFDLLPEDCEIIKSWTGQSWKSWFTYPVVAVKIIFEREVVVGTSTFFGRGI